MRSLPILIVFIVHSLEEEAQQVLDIFHDRVLVAQCRAGCDLRYLDDLDRGQCWTVCHLLASAPVIWTQICEGREVSVCGPGCQTACSHYKATDLKIVEAREEAEVSEGLVRVSSSEDGAHGVYILVARDKEGAWYELMQTQKREMESMGDMMEAWVIRVTAGGEVSIISVKEGEHWELFLGHIEPDSGHFLVEVFWTKDTAGEEVTVTWSLDTVRGVMVTRDTRVMLPVPPGARVTVQVYSEVTGAVSDSLPLDIPGAEETVSDDTEEAASSETPGGGSFLVLVIFIVLLLFLAVTVGLVISLYRRTKLLCSSQSWSSVRESSQSLSSDKNRSLISFDTFVMKNRISVPEIVSTRANMYTVNV